MTKEKSFSKEHLLYIKKQKKDNAFILIMRFAILFLRRRQKRYCVENRT